MFKPFISTNGLLLLPRPPSLDSQFISTTEVGRESVPVTLKSKGTGGTNVDEVKVSIKPAMGLKTAVFGKYSVSDVEAVTDVELCELTSGIASVSTEAGCLKGLSTLTPVLFTRAWVGMFDGTKSFPSLSNKMQP